MAMQTKFTKQLNILLRDFGYRYSGGILIKDGVRGYTSPRIVARNLPDIYAAVEYLIPIICCDEFYNRYSRIGED